jgi:hypothetical protein
VLKCLTVGVSQFGKESLLVDREAECHRRTIARKRAMDYQSRALRLHLGAPKLSRGRQDVDIQTDVRLEQVSDFRSIRRKISKFLYIIILSGSEKKNYETFYFPKIIIKRFIAYIAPQKYFDQNYIDQKYIHKCDDCIILTSWTA